MSSCFLICGEDFLDGLGFLRSSPIRQHVRQLFGREDLEEQLRGMTGLHQRIIGGIHDVLRKYIHIINIR